MDPILLTGLLAVVAFAYALVGHGGASGYLALMALAGLSIAVMRPSALILNLFVSAIAFTQYARAGHFRWKTFWPFAVLSVPMAWVGARIVLDPVIYKGVLAFCLLFAVARLFGLFGQRSAAQRPVPFFAALGIGAVLGLLSGMIGIGGGILLSPILMLCHWADAKTTAATSALFIFVNSAAGIAGVFATGEVLPSEMLPWILAAGCGGLLGSWLGSNHLPELRLRQALGSVLLFASVKLMLP
ncbi:MAG: sulfite exporter TauE/SafE family protein [Flavobacteriales bacterium]|nr:sulfite exporter TauE/SafE family protein [Flavobacteriales bacterium]